MSEHRLPGTSINGEHFVFSDYFAENNFIQNVAIIQPKNLLIQTIRDSFRNDSVYTYRQNEYGFPLTKDLTGVSLDDESYTKIVIADSFRPDVKFFPIIVVSTVSGSDKALSFNQEGTYKYKKDIVENQFGGKKVILTPTHKVYAGRWDLNIEISVNAESLQELDEITEILISILNFSQKNNLRFRNWLLFYFKICFLDNNIQRKLQQHKEQSNHL